MAELNGSGSFNTTNRTFCSLHYCSGPWLSKTTLIATYLACMTFSLLGNVLIVAVFYRNKTLRTAVHYFIVNMAISDLMLPLITLPASINGSYRDGHWLIGGVLGKVSCNLVQLAWPVSTVVSLLSMIAIAVDRFRAVLFPMKFALFSRHKRWLIIAATWVASAAFALTYLYQVIKVHNRDTRNDCFVQWRLGVYASEQFRIYWVIFCCLSGVAALILTVLYSSIIIYLHRHKINLHLSSEKVKKRRRRNRKIAYMLVTIVIVFYVVWAPFFLLFYYHFLKPGSQLPCVFVWLAARLSFLYPVINPVVYFLFNRDYRQGFKELLRCSWLPMNKCNDCFQPPVALQGANNIYNVVQVNNPMNENIELHEQ